MYIVVLSIFCFVFPFEFFVLFFPSPFGGERRGEHDGKGGEVYMAVFYLRGWGAEVSCMMRKEWRCTWLYFTFLVFQITRRNPTKILKWWVFFLFCH